MKLNCKNCNQEFEGKRVTASYCSSKCRKLAFLGNNKVSVPVVSVPIVSDNGLKEIHVTLEEVCTPDELKRWPAFCETKRCQKESIYRLENNPIEVLKEKNIFIPAKYAHQSKGI